MCLQAIPVSPRQLCVFRAYFRKKAARSDGGKLFRMSGKVLELHKRTDDAPSAADIRFADCLYDDHHLDLRWFPARGWLRYDGRRWEYDETNSVLSWAEFTARRLLSTAASLPDEERRKAALNFAVTYSQSKHMKYALELLKPRMAVTIDQLDVWRRFLNVENVTIDLRTGEPRAHNRDDLITKIVPIRFNRNADRPRWRDFVTELFEDGRRTKEQVLELYEYLQRLTGYLLTGEQT